MKRTMKKYFISHADNNYHPHILHSKRTLLYGGVCLAMKGIVFLFVLLLPSTVFLLPDVLQAEQKKIIAYTNELRSKNLTEQPLLNRSAELKAGDMVSNQYFDHVGPNGRNLNYFLGQVGYPYQVAGENLAMGFSTAEDVIRAWKQSPTHNANLVDLDFNDIGVSIAAGEYQGVPTVFIAQHFGAPKKSIMPVVAETRTTAPAPKKPDAKPVPAPSQTVSEEKVLGNVVAVSEQIVPPAPVKTVVLPVVDPIQIIPVESLVAWEGGIGKTVLSGTVMIKGNVKKAEIFVNEYTIPLNRAAADQGMFIGTVTVPVEPESLFQVVTMPIVQVEGIDGTVVSAAVPWERILMVSPTPIEKYTQSRSSLGFLTNIFSVQRFLYLAIFLFVALSLLLNIALQIHKRHPHVVFQTAGLLVLIAILIVV